jgi:hypothetical protein
VGGVVNLAANVAGQSQSLAGSLAASVQVSQAVMVPVQVAQGAVQAVQVPDTSIYPEAQAKQSAAEGLWHPLQAALQVAHDVITLAVI